MSEHLGTSDQIEADGEDTGSSPVLSTPVAARNGIDPALVGVDPSNYNLRNPAVKRLLREAAELAPLSDEIYARPLEDNLFEWHFTIRGAPDSDFAVGVYHGRIILPTEYPMKPPSIILLTPNGRFDTGTKICLSISSYHPETWRPSWSIRTALVALISFMTTDSPGAIGSVEMDSETRRSLARQSLTWQCPQCGPSIQHIRYVCTQPSSGGPKAQQLFRLPHNPQELFDSGVPPEQVIRHQVNGPITIAVDGRAGDAGGRMGNGMEVEEDEEEVEGDLELGNGMAGSLLSLAIGGVIICIGGIILNRLLNSEWWNRFID